MGKYFNLIGFRGVITGKEYCAGLVVFVCPLNVSGQGIAPLIRYGHTRNTLAAIIEFPSKMQVGVCFGNLALQLL